MVRAIYVSIIVYRSQMVCVISNFKWNKGCHSYIKFVNDVTALRSRSTYFSVAEMAPPMGCLLGRAGWGLSPVMALLGCPGLTVVMPFLRYHREEGQLCLHHGSRVFASREEINISSLALFRGFRRDNSAMYYNVGPLRYRHQVAVQAPDDSQTQLDPISAHCRFAIHEVSSSLSDVKSESDSDSASTSSGLSS